MVFLFGDRFDEIYGMRRGLSDGRWKYIRRFTPNKPAAPYSYYQFSMPSWVAWQKAWKDGKLSKEYTKIWETPQEVEELFDLQADPWEIKNLVSDPAQNDRLAAMEKRLKEEMLQVHDTGVIPEPMWDELTKGKAIADYAASKEFDLKEAITAAFTFSDPTQFSGLDIRMAASMSNPVVRYWALRGNLNSINMAEGSIAIEMKMLTDKVSVNRVSAAEVFCAAGQKDAGHKALLAELGNLDVKGDSMLYLTNAIAAENLFSEVPRDWAKRVLANKKSNEYVKRFAKRVLKE